MKLLVLALSLFAFNAQAAEATAPAGVDYLSCSFTEPFFSLDFSPSSGFLEKTSPDIVDAQSQTFKKIVVAVNTKFVQDVKGEYNDYAIVDENGKVLVKLKLSGAGSDGMSTLLFPFEATYEGNSGACSTTRAPAYDSDAIVESLK